MDLLLLALMAWADIKVSAKSAQETSVWVVEAKTRTTSDAWEYGRVSAALPTLVEVGGSDEARRVPPPLPIHEMVHGP